MNFEEAETKPNNPSSKGKMLGVIMIIDNRNNRTQQKPPLPDYRCSGFKETEVDPLESPLNQNSFALEDSLLSQLARRVTYLENRVQALSTSHGISQQQDEERTAVGKRKNRRKFKDLARDHRCSQCQKNYGSETSLKYHMKLKHLGKEQDSMGRD